MYLFTVTLFFAPWWFLLTPRPLRSCYVRIVLHHDRQLSDTVFCFGQVKVFVCFCCLELCWDYWLKQTRAHINNIFQYSVRTHIFKIFSFFIEICLKILNLETLHSSHASFVINTCIYNCAKYCPSVLERYWYSCACSECTCS